VVSSHVNWMSSRLTPLNPGQAERDGVECRAEVDDPVLAGAVGRDGSNLLDEDRARGFDRRTGQHGPDASLTTPASDACASASEGTSTRHARTHAPTRRNRFIRSPTRYEDSEPAVDDKRRRTTTVQAWCGRTVARPWLTTQRVSCSFRS
jgi:hypothetical protein